ncbi:unnamed protein product [Rodentolepis nana]|uniref:Ovule protein n=1 Tax=Rodentolepis nana TaxID=102285 RepID=A0A0R3TEJ6_RODNA|nr:unnamed protein product [Rodentolepis nana]
MNVLHSGFGFSQNYNNLHPIDKLAEIEVQWSLGAFIYHMQTLSLINTKSHSSLRALSNGGSMLSPYKKNMISTGY